MEPATVPGTAFDAAASAPDWHAAEMPESARLFESGDLGLARDEIGRVYCPYRYRAGGASRHPASMHNLPGAQVGLSRFAYGREIAIEPEVFPDFALVLATVAGHADIEAGGFRHSGAAGVVVVPPGVASRYRYSADNVQLVARIDIGRVAAVGRALSGRGGARFALRPQALVRRAQVARWLALLQGLKQALHPDAPPLLRAMLLPRAEELLILDLLFEQDALCGTEASPAGGVSPACLRRAVAFIEAHADQPLTLLAVAGAAQCSVRTLQRVFHDWRGIGVMQFLKAVRLQRVRRALLDADGGETVTGAALRWGFAHLGQFAVDYRKAFGEKPSETLRRRG